jgi:RNA polymerase sigma-70 factor (ECF subfamily)
MTALVLPAFLDLRALFAMRPGALVCSRPRVRRDAAVAQPPMDPEEARRFREAFLPLLDAAYGYARTLTRDPTAAEDLVQDAYLRACRAFRGYRGGEAKAWLFAIVRSSFLSDVRRRQPWSELDEAGEVADPADTAEAQIVRRDGEHDVRAAVEALPDPFREAIVLRELQELSYREIAEITGAPIGTVMSRLARARRLLAESLQLMEVAP